MANNAVADYSPLPLNFFDAVSYAHAKTKFLNENTDDLNQYNLLNLILPLLTSNSNDLFSTLTLPNITTACYDNIMNFVNAFSNNEKWTTLVLDSFGKPGSGILQGNLLWTGEYRQCLNISVPDVGFKGKYCGVYTAVSGLSAGVSIRYWENLH